MILLDLKLGLFVIVLGVVGASAGMWWLAGHRAREFRQPASAVWQVFESLPVGVVVIGPDSAVAFVNAVGQRLLSELDEDLSVATSELLCRLDDEPASASSRSGLLFQPMPLR